MQRLFMVNSALQSPTAFKTSPLVPEHVSWAIWCVTVYGYIHPGSTCPETTGQCWEHGYSETTDNVNIWPGLGEHQVLAGGYHPLSDFYYWHRNVSAKNTIISGHPTWMVKNAENNRKTPKIPDLQSPDRNQPYWMTLYIMILLLLLHIIIIR